MKKFPIYYEWVQTLIDYNDELIEIIDNIHSKPTKTKATATHRTSLIDLDVSKCENVQSTTSNSRPSTAPNNMNYEDILNQNVRLDPSFLCVFILNTIIYILIISLIYMLII